MSDCSISLPVLDTVSSDAFRNAMARFGSAVHLVTTDGPAGKAGFAASAVCSLSDSPPSLLICLQRRSSAFDAVMANKVVCVNTLSVEGEALSRQFGGKTPMNERFLGANWHTLATGAPALVGAACAFDCRVATMVEVETHCVLLCTVVALGSLPADHSCLIYAGRGYHGVVPQSA